MSDNGTASAFWRRACAARGDLPRTPPTRFGVSATAPPCRVSPRTSCCTSASGRRPGCCGMPRATRRRGYMPVVLERFELVFPVTERA